jgi:hypothetical protein
MGACIDYFDSESTGQVNCKAFESHFLKVGIAERGKDHSTSLKKQRENETLRQREHEQKLIAQWAKHDLKVANTFTSQLSSMMLHHLVQLV